jgi:methionyl-tRNA formyltransferase
MRNIIIATTRQYGEYFEYLNNQYSEFDFHFIESKTELNPTYLSKYKPKYIFFPFWSWIIPEEVYSKYKCIGFHTADLPYGRGGSPIQNQIIRGITKTKICAIDIVKELDAGDIYLTRNIDISKGNIDEIISEISDIIYMDMIPYIIDNHPKPEKQKGTVIEFKRREVWKSDIRYCDGNLYDHIRMLDGEGYPKACLEMDNIKIEFSNVARRNGYLEGRFIVHEK